MSVAEKSHDARGSMAPLVHSRRGGHGPGRGVCTSDGSSRLKTLTRAGMVFQTMIAFTIAGPDAKALDDAMSAAFFGVRDGERALSVYRTDSDLSRLNRHGFIEAPHLHLRHLVAHAPELAKETEGVFDPTVQAFMGCFGAASRARWTAQR